MLAEKTIDAKELRTRANAPLPGAVHWHITGRIPDYTHIYAEGPVTFETAGNFVTIHTPGPIKGDTIGEGCYLSGSAVDVGKTGDSCTLQSTLTDVRIGEAGKAVLAQSSGRIQVDREPFPVIRERYDDGATAHYNQPVSRRFRELVEAGIEYHPKKRSYTVPLSHMVERPDTFIDMLDRLKTKEAEVKEEGLAVTVEGKLMPLVTIRNPSKKWLTEQVISRELDAYAAEYTAEKGRGR